MLDLLGTMSIPAREAGFIASEYRPDDMRHTGFEASFSEECFFVDVDMGVMFADAGGGAYWNALDIKDSCDGANISEENMVRPTKNKKVDAGFPLGYIEWVMKDDSKLLEWYKHKSSAVIIANCIYTTADESVISGHVLDSIKGTEKYLGRANFEKIFYRDYPHKKRI